MITIKDVTSYLETIAPLDLQESYDNAGLIIGDESTEVKGILICLDSTEEIIEEALKNRCNLVIAHHPIVFSGLKKLNGKNYVERTVIKAIQNNIAIYAAHTNLDNIRQGVNAKICERIGLKDCKILSPKRNLLGFWSRMPARVTRSQSWTWVAPGENSAWPFIQRSKPETSMVKSMAWTSVHK